MERNQVMQDIVSQYHRIIRLHLQHAHAQLEPIGVFPGQAPIMFVLMKQSQLTQKEIAKRLCVRAATLTTMLQRMEKSGFIERHTDPQDQRKIRVSLTSHGEKIAKKARGIVQVMESEMFVGLDEEELRILHQLLTVMENNLCQLHGKQE